MSVASDPSATPPDATGAGRLFGLSETDSRLLRDTCVAALRDIGLESDAFFDRLSAGAAFGEALGIGPDIQDQLYERAHRWFSVGRGDRAEPLFRALCVCAGDDADYWVGLGVCLRLRDDAAGAALAFDTAARLRPDWAVPVFHLCELHLRRGELDAAARALDRFRALADAETPPRLIEEAGRLGEAIRFRRETAKSAPA